jgi:hypothetical protein
VAIRAKVRLMAVPAAAAAQVYPIMMTPVLGDRRHPSMSHTPCL